MEKRGVELSLNFVILVVIGLLVATVAVYLVIKFSGAPGGALECRANGGQCRNSCDNDETPAGGLSCPEEGHICCRPNSLFEGGG